MKKRYQIDTQRAVQSFRQMVAQTDNSIQLVIPLKEVVDLIQRGLRNLALSAFNKVAEHVMDYEVTALVGPKNQAQAERANLRWGSQPGYCVVGGQKIPLDRPRVRDTRQREVSLGSYALLQRASLMEESVWQKMIHGLTTRRYSQVLEELEKAYGIKKSTISDPEEHCGHVLPLLVKEVELAVLKQIPLRHAAMA
ncbi:MAG TPA: transposase [Bryobacteraceae bacterium]|nr:transposase [Bryobacteraceae bacterium]